MQRGVLMSLLISMALSACIHGAWCWCLVHKQVVASLLFGAQTLGSLPLLLMVLCGHLRTLGPLRRQQKVHATPAAEPARSEPPSPLSSPAPSPAPAPLPCAITISEEPKGPESPAWGLGPGPSGHMEDPPEPFNWDRLSASRLSASISDASVSQRPSLCPTPRDHPEAEEDDAPGGATEHPVADLWVVLVALSFVALDVVWAVCGVHSMWFLVAVLPVAGLRGALMWGPAAAVLGCAALSVLLAASHGAPVPVRPGLSAVGLLLAHGGGVLLPTAVLVLQLACGRPAPASGRPAAVRKAPATPAPGRRRAPRGASDSDAGSPAGSPRSGSVRGSLTSGVSSCHSRQSRVSAFSGKSPLSYKYHAGHRPLSYTISKLVGTGAFSEVYLAMSHDTGTLICAKQLAKGCTDFQQMEADVAILRQLRHPNIVTYLGVDRGDAFTILLEYVPGGSLESLLAQYGALDDDVARYYMRQATVGLAYLHGKGIVHRDVKGANILVSDKGAVKLADFGCSYSNTLPREALPALGTVLWMAPEVCQERPLAASSDIWSLGCTVLQCLVNALPWSERGFDNCAAAFYHIALCAAPPKIPRAVSPAARDFMAGCLSVEPALRPDCRGLLQHEWLAGLADAEPEEEEEGEAPESQWVRRLPRALRVMSIASALSFRGGKLTRSGSAASGRSTMSSAVAGKLRDQRRFLHEQSMRSMAGVRRADSGVGSVASAFNRPNRRAAGRGAAPARDRDRRRSSNSLRSMLSDVSSGAAESPPESGRHPGAPGSHPRLTHSALQNRPDAPHSESEVSEVSEIEAIVDDILC